jgi:transposase-like protein
LGKRGPKSKYDSNLHPQITKWMCRSGLTNEEIAKELRISKDTLWKWRDKYPEIADALKTSRNFVDSLVEDALLKRALGFEYEETEVNWITLPDGETKPGRIKKIKKLALPDTGAMCFWLKCRMPERWRESNPDRSNVFNIMQGVLIVPGEKQPEDWDEAAKAIHTGQEKFLSQD